ncbi:hypothetical protein PMLGA01_140034300 [Plasmodium malariae]|uniref:SNARE protein n=1 Tax=Plasmodium malariae TaxID=5858 RepID=A0A1C3L2P3_PLAMA|nr:hypothetical protein PMLGA01_140034300 [Plasmodium malariae]
MDNYDMHTSNNFDLTMSNNSNKIVDTDKLAMENKYNSNYIRKLSMNDNFVNTDLQISYMENEIQNRIKDLDASLGKKFENKCDAVLNRIEKLLSCDFLSEH